MKGPILVILAAGLGSRYGGLKQIDRIGKNGEVLLDFSVFDAMRAGFERAVFIIRRDMEDDFNDIVLRRIQKRFPCDLAFQEPDRLIPPEILAESRRVNRTKPWGTTHALLSARDQIDGPFMVINADDFYGREAFEAMAGFFQSPDRSEGAIVPYRLEKTLSPQGTVTRGICEIQGDYLVSVDELTAIEKQGGIIFNTAADGSRREFPPDTPVSMNCWGFPVSVFSPLERYFGEFLKAGENLAKAECYLPLAADWFVKNRILRIRALPADSSWFGVTYREDRETAAVRIGELTARGVYPASLWGF